MELLAPAGSINALKMAVQCGADAVYLGGHDFNARASATNFSKEELQFAFDYCHTHNVKAFITLNTLLYDDEILRAYDAACDMAQMGADAFIIQDVGLLDLLHSYTNFELHASTQMSIHNLEGVEVAKQLGCKRVVLARETPLEDIKRIKQNTDTEIEVFVHGALCVSFSGQCLFSSLAGARSGNRGKCAQACRLPYSLYKNNSVLDEGYLLSPKDLCSISYLRDLYLAGADSLKIEGRLKRPEYVGVVTEQYRKALDIIKDGGSFDESYAIKELAAIFNRGGFTKGYYVNANDIIYRDSPNNTGIKVGKVLSNDGRNILSYQEITKGDGVDIRDNGKSLGGGAIFDIKVNGIKQNSFNGKGTVNILAKNSLGAEIFRTTNKVQIDRINTYLQKEQQRIGLNIYFKQKASDISLTLDDNGVTANVCKAYDFVEGNTSDKDVAASLSKFGGTQYCVDEIKIEHLGGYIPQGLLNSMRREAVELLDNNKINNAKTHKEFVDSKLITEIPSSNQAWDNGKSIFAYSYQQLCDFCKSGIYQRVYFKPYDYNNEYSVPRDRKCEVYFVPFDISFYEDMDLYKNIKDFDGIYAENIFVIMLARQANMKCIAGCGLNILNTYSARVYNKLGCDIITASCEAHMAQINKIAKACHTEVIINGRLPMMKLVCCPAQQQNYCKICDGDFVIKDRFGNKFGLSKFKTARCRNILLNCANLNLKKETLDLNVSYCDLNNSCKGASETKGHYRRGV